MNFPSFTLLLVYTLILTLVYPQFAQFQLQLSLNQQKNTPHTFSIEVLEKNMISHLENAKVAVPEEKQTQIETNMIQNGKQRLLSDDSLRRVQEEQPMNVGRTSYSPVQKQNSPQIRVNIQNNGLQTPLKQSKIYQKQQTLPYIGANAQNIKIPGRDSKTVLQEAQKAREQHQKTINMYSQQHSPNAHPQPILSYSVGNNQRLNAVKWREIVQQNFQEITPKMIEEYEYYEKKYDISSYEELPFCIVVPTFNNQAEQRYLRNIRSIVMQNYTNYHIVVMDDGSTDGTGDLILQYLTQQTSISRYTFEYVRNEEQKKAMFSLRRAALQFCQPSEIFLIVDGDDELVGRQVLKLFNSMFQKTGAWFVYSNFIMNQGTSVGYSRPFPRNVIDGNNYRKYPFVTSHLRAFYTKLFANIKEDDLKDENGDYYRAANDVAICIPILQQSHNRVEYLPELTYYYNSNTGQNNHIVRAMQQRNNDRKIRRKDQYHALENLFESM